jgi:hypothetical protein
MPWGSSAASIRKSQAAAGWIQGRGFFLLSNNNNIFERGIQFHFFVK